VARRQPGRWPPLQSHMPSGSWLETIQSTAARGAEFWPGVPDDALAAYAATAAEVTTIVLEREHVIAGLPDSLVPGRQSQVSQNNQRPEGPAVPRQVVVALGPVAIAMLRSQKLGYRGRRGDCRQRSLHVQVVSRAAQQVSQSPGADRRVLRLQQPGQRVASQPIKPAHALPPQVSSACGPPRAGVRRTPGWRGRRQAGS